MEKRPVEQRSLADERPYITTVYPTWLVWWDDAKTMYKVARVRMDWDSRTTMLGLEIGFPTQEEAMVAMAQANDMDGGHVLQRCR